MLNSHEEIIHKNILPRLDVLEEAQNAFRQEVTMLKADLVGVQRGQAQLEVTVMKDGKQTRELLKQFVDHYFKQDDEEVQAEKDKIQAEKDIKIKKMEAREKIYAGVFGVGGLAGIITAVGAVVSIFFK